MEDSAGFSLLVCAAEERLRSLELLLVHFPWVHYCSSFAEEPEAQFSVTWVPDEGMARAAAAAWHSGMGHLLLASTTATLADLGLLDAHASRYCGWPGFEQQAAWEVASAAGADTVALDHFLKHMGKSRIAVADVPGFIAPRTIAWLVNEAWYVWKEGVATPEDIDLAMQLGTNYPMGPLAWANQIGVAAIAGLLHRLSAPDRISDIHPNLLQYLPA